MYDLQISDLADADLDAMVKYIAVELANAAAAIGFLDKLEGVYHFLKTSPGIYPLCDDSRLRSKGYRKTVVGNYILIFRIEKSARKVHIVRFFYGGQDYITLL